MRPQAERDPAADHIRPDLENLLLRFRNTTSIVNFMPNVWTPSQGTIHSPSPGPARVLQQARAALGAGVGDIGPIGQHAAAALVRETRKLQPKLRQS